MWLREANQTLSTEVGGLRVEVGRDGDAFRYAVLRRQYGDGSLLALIGSGTEPTLMAAMREAERFAHAVELAPPPDVGDAPPPDIDDAPAQSAA